MSHRLPLRATVLTALALTAATVIGGCAAGVNDSTRAGNDATMRSTARVTGTIIVFAAASLTEAFTTIGKQFEAAYRGTTVKLNFGASSALATQINQGAPADVFASASRKNMSQVVSAG